MTAPQLLSSSFRYLTICAALMLVNSLPAWSQDRCGTVEYTHKLQQRRDVIETPQQFEQWLRGRTLARDGAGHRPKSASYQIPVVVHIIHNGEAVGTGTNLSVAQVQSQIKTLNLDYQRLNADRTNTLPDFAAVAGSLDIEFVLAKQDPEGLATSGIVRVKGTKTSWTMKDNYQLKGLSYWDSNDYLNVWVCNLTDYLGYTQFPVSTLPGLENSSNNAQTDGVVITYDAFGSADDGPFALEPKYNKGRTATHEIGHFFGLRHIWGDDGTACGPPGDYVDDTPDQAGQTSNCPTTPATTCGPKAMFQNYMDYTDDQCMNLFTAHQVDRMITVLGNSPRRSTLSTSHGLLDPTPVANDAGIRTILAPEAVSCSPTVTPSVEIRNTGSNTITAVTLELKVNGVLQQTKIFSPLSLAQAATMVLTLDDMTLTPGTPADFDFAITATNNSTDGNVNNNSASIETVTPNTLGIPFTEPFTTQPADWSISNPDLSKTWTLAAAPNISATNKAMLMNFFDYEDADAEIDILTTPVLNLSAQPLAVLYFDIAYAPLKGQDARDGLKVYVLKDCDENIFDGTLVYSKVGGSVGTLNTVEATYNAFVPQRATDWRKEAVNLAGFIGEQHIQIAFVGVNAFGNNLYLDNVQVLNSEYEDISLLSVSPDRVTCETQPHFELTVRNAGTLPISTFHVDVQSGSQTLSQDIAFDAGSPLAPSATATVSLNAYTLAHGDNTVIFDLSKPNGNLDVNGDDNHLEATVTVNDTGYEIPYRGSFEDGFGGDWVLINPTHGMQWQTHADVPMFGTSAYFRAFSNTKVGDEAWLISPVFDFSSATAASLQFYSAYAVNDIHKDRLRVLYSTNCGTTFQPMPLFDKSGSDLSAKKSTSEWTPQTLTDWQHRVIDLSTLAGQKNLRFAFVATNDNGNDIYVDNINFSTTTEPNPLLNEQRYVIYRKASDQYDFHFTFNLSEKEMVRYQVIDTMGRLVLQGEIPDVLNQTYPVSLGGNQAEGVYIVRFSIGSRYYSTKLFLGR